MPRKIIGALAAVVCLAMLTLALSALQTRDNVSAQQLAQPSDRPPLFGTQTAQAATAQAAATQTAAAAVFSPAPPPASRQPPPTVATIVPFPTATRPRVTRTPSATPSSTDTPTPTQTAIPASVFETATSAAATDQAATVQAIVALTSTALRLSQPAATAPATPIPVSPTTAPLTAYPSFPQTTPAAAAGILEANPWLWLVVAVPFIALALALLWLIRRRFPLYPGWGRPRRGSRRAGRRYVRRRSFPF